MSTIVGIDLGTTYSAVGHMSEDGPKLIPNALGQVLTPSAVGIDLDGKLLVGQAARELQVLHPDRCITTFKRYMGTDWKGMLGLREFTPEELSSLVLASLKHDAEAALQQPIDRAVITVPAYFNDNQRKATLAAGRIAGFQVERILNEPTAAAIAYGMHSLNEDKVLVVLDLGGGTFDVSVVELFAGTMEVRASSGETFLGGEDFTLAIVARVLEERGHVFEHAESAHPRMVSRLRQECEQAKKKLSRQESVPIRVPDVRGNLDDSVPPASVSRAQFDRWTESLLNRLEGPIRRALGDARLSRADVSEVILVGGATRMPAVQKRASEIFGRPASCRLNPDEVVALGAAVQAGLIANDVRLADVVVTDVSPFTLGVEVSKEFASEQRPGYFLPIINRNTTIPVSRVERVATVQPNQSEVHVKVYQGEGRRTEQNLLLGEFQVNGIPRGPAGRPIDIRFTYDLNGILEVEATIVETGASISHIIARHAQGMSEREIAAAVAAMKLLKTHPREESRNRFLIRRAERVYQELPLDGRKLLEQLLTGFEESLELQEPEAIDRHREQLESFLQAHDGDTSGDANDEHDRSF